MAELIAVGITQSAWFDVTAGADDSEEPFPELPMDTMARLGLKMIQE